MTQFGRILVVLGLFTVLTGYGPVDRNGIEQASGTGIKAPPDLAIPAARKDWVVVRKPGPIPGAAEQTTYRNGRIAEKLVFRDNRPWELVRYDYMDERSRYSVKTMLYYGDNLYMVRNDLFENTVDPLKSDHKIESRYYNFDKSHPNTLRQVDTYWPGTPLVKERQVFGYSGCFENAAQFEYHPDADQWRADAFGNLDGATRMILINGNGDVVGDYQEKTAIDLKSLYRDRYSEAEIVRRERISMDSTRTPVLVLDSGIDISHPELAYKLWKNPTEVLNGRDDDGNGLTDDIYGVSDNPRLAQPVQDLRLPQFGLPAFSHGTLVASVLAQGREDVAVMAASEMTANNSSGILPKVERFIKSHGVRFTNMSFIYDKQILNGDSGAQRPFRIKQLIHNTPETLHVVAAGNGASINGKGFNLDELRQAGDLVPAMLPDDNILVVGALDTDRLHLPDYPSYAIAAFSNVGETSVDILAPGTGICGARMGGGTICENGTSFAAPYVLNHGVLDVANTNPALSIYQIKEILMKTAYIPDLEHPLPVRSGGILHPQRAVAVAKRLKNHPSESVEAAVLAIRKLAVHIIPGEKNHTGALLALQNFWERRGIGASGPWYAQADN